MTQNPRLNPAQRKAVETINGPVLVLAGAGTGKTTVITWRIAHMLQRGIAPESILAVTFTNKAAREMRERLARILSPAQVEGLTVRTFHSFCCLVLRRHISRLKGFDADFGIADESDQEGLIRQVMGEVGLGIRDKTLDSGLVRRMISQAKMNLIGPDEFYPTEYDEDRRHSLARAYVRYQELLRSMNLVDFDDLLFLTIHLWQTQPDLLTLYRERYPYLLVDEYQDANAVQSKLVRLLAEPRNNVCVVGDDDQSIYSWRGAQPENILHFHKDYAGAKVIKLEENYRSTNAILKAANELIACNTNRHGKNLRSALGDGDKVMLVETADETAEARVVGRLIKEYAAAHKLKYQDMAILCRSNHQTRIFEQTLRGDGVPYRIIGGKSFYERREIKDAAAYLRLVHNPRDDLALLRIVNCPPRGFGAVSLEKLKARRDQIRRPLSFTLAEAEFQQQLPPRTATQIQSLMRAWKSARQAFATPGGLAEKAKNYFHQTQYLDGLGHLYKNRNEALVRYENVIEFLSSMMLFEQRVGPQATLEDFLENASLMDDHDRSNSRKEKEKNEVSIMTVHAAKGLEFPLVIVVGMELNTFPHERAIKERSLSEERRLFYVAMTRAKSHLILTRARARTRFNEKQRMRQSLFLREIPEELLNKVDEKSAFQPAKREDIDHAIADMLARFDD